MTGPVPHGAGQASEKWRAIHAEARMGYEVIREKLTRGQTILLDGGMGTEILRRGVYWRSHGI